MTGAVPEPPKLRQSAEFQRWRRRCCVTRRPKKLSGGVSTSLTEASINGFTIVTSFTATSSAERYFDLSGAAVAAKYLYFIPGPYGTDNDYLVWKVGVDQTVPEPATLLLLGTALGGVAALRPRRRGRD